MHTTLDCFFSSVALFFIGGPLIFQRRKCLECLRIYRLFSVGIFLKTLCEVILVILAATALCSIPFLKHGWMNLVFHDGVSLTMAPFHLASSGSPNFFLKRCLPALFCLLLFVVAPYLALNEEIEFRVGHNDWRSITKQSLKFGFSHCFMGIPLGAGAALCIAGLFFGYHYRRSYATALHRGACRPQFKAVIESTIYHTMHNVIIFSVLLVFFLFIS